MAINKKIAEPLNFLLINKARAKAKKNSITIEIPAIKAVFPNASPKEVVVKTVM